MNSTALEPVRWPRRRWAYAVGAVFALQAALVFFLSRPEPRLPERPIFRTAIHLVAGEEAERQLASRAGMDEPALLALPGQRGFSGPAWLTFPPLDYQPAEWVEPPHWLSFDAGELGSTFKRFVATNFISPALTADKPLPPLPRYEPSFPNEPLAGESHLRITGELAGRPLLFPLQPKSWPHTEILSNTTVQAAVDADGFVFSPVLMAGSGLKEADVHALALAAGARFRPLPRAARTRDGNGPFTWGELVFQWKTLPSTTNLSVVPP